MNTWTAATVHSYLHTDINVYRKTPQPWRLSGNMEIYSCEYDQSYEKYQTMIDQRYQISFNHTSLLEQLFPILKAPLKKTCEARFGG